MATKRGNVFYVKRRFSGVGPVYKSLGTRNKERAKTLEGMLGSLHDQGRFDLVRAFSDGELGIDEIAEHYEASKIHELTDRLAREDVPLSDAIDKALQAKEPDVRSSTYASYRKGLEHFNRYVGGDTLIPDAFTTDQIQGFKGFRKREGAKPETINNDLIGISVVVTYPLEKGWLAKRPKMKRFKTKVRVTYLEPDQLTPYFAVVRRAFRPIFQLLVLKQA